jgi:hypothetical protein
MRVEVPKEGGKVDTVVSAARAALFQDGTDVVVIARIVQICHNQGLGPPLHGLRIHSRKGTEGSFGKDRQGWEHDGRLGLLLSSIRVAPPLLHGLLNTTIIAGIGTARQSHLPQRSIAVDGALDELRRLRRRPGRITSLAQAVVMILDGSHRSSGVCWTVARNSRRSAKGLDGRQRISDAARDEVEVGRDSPIRRRRGGRRDGRLGRLLDRTAHTVIK